MAQHDYVIANGTGAAVRSDLNSGLAAIVSQNSGATEPTTTYAYMRWADTATGVMKMRNGANNAWITLYQLDGEWSTIAFENGSAAAPSIYFKDSGTDTGIYSPGADQVAISTGGTGRLFVSSGGLVGIGTSAPSANLEINSTSVAFGTTGSLQINGQQTNQATGSEIASLIFGSGSSSGSNGAKIVTRKGSDNQSDSLTFHTSSGGGALTERLRISAGGAVGIGSTAPGSLLDLRSASAPSLHISTTGYTPDYRGYSIDLSQSQETGGINFTTSSPSAFLDLYAGGSAANLGGWNGQIRFFTGGTNSYGTERARIDSSGRLLVGTSSSTNGRLVVSTTSGSAAIATQQDFSSGYDESIAIIRAAGSGADVSANTPIGNITWKGIISGTAYKAASIDALVDGTPGAGDMPGRLVFSTTADGASSPTERMRINQELSGSTKGIVEVNLATNNAASSTGWGVKINGASGGGGNSTTGGFYYDSSSGIANYATHYGIYIKNTGIGTGDPRYGGYFEVTSANSYVSNYGIYAKANSAGNEGLYGTIYAIRAEATSSATGTTANVVGAYVSNNNWVNGRCMEMNDAYSVSTSHTLINITRNSSVVGTIATTLSATAYNTSSDYRLKENITTVTDGITRLQQLKPKRFNFIVDPNKTVDGFLAHEVQDVVPECITGTKDELDADGNPVYQGIDQSKLVPLLTAALQEAVAEIKALKDRVTALEAA